MIVAVLIISVWIIIEIKRFKHKLFALILIALILFTYIGFTAVVSGKDLDLKTAKGLTEASKIYFSWLYSIGENFKKITINAIKMDWGTKYAKNNTFFDKLQ